MKCPYQEACPIYRSRKLRDSYDYIKEYCTDNCRACVRYHMKKKGEHVPIKMLPDGTLLDPAILKKKANITLHA